MSEQSQGPGWWQASDGRWYPPESATPPPDESAGPRPGEPYYQAPSGAGGPDRSKVVAGVVAGVVVLVALIVGAVVLLGGDDDEEQADPPDITAVPDEDEPAETEDPDEPEPDGPDDEPGSPDVPEGFQLIEGSEGDFSIAIPEDWQSEDQDFEVLAEQLQEDNPELGAALEQSLPQLESSGALFAFGPPRPDGSVDSINILRLPPTGGEIPPGLEVQLRSQLEGLGATDLESTELEVPVGPAVRGQYNLPINRPDGSQVEVTTVQYYVVTPDGGWVLTYSTVDDDASLIDEVIETFRGA